MALDMDNQIVSKLMVWIVTSWTVLVDLELIWIVMVTVLSMIVVKKIGEIKCVIPYSMFHIKVS